MLDVLIISYEYCASNKTQHLVTLSYKQIALLGILGQVQKIGIQGCLAAKLE